MGSGLDGLSDAVAGDQGNPDGSTADNDPSRATRKLISRPISFVAKAMSSAGDAADFVGDTTEKLASEAIGILPDSMRIVESTVRGIREGLGGDDAEDAPRAVDALGAAEGGGGSTPPVGVASGPRLQLRRSDALAAHEVGESPGARMAERTGVPARRGGKGASGLQRMLLWCDSRGEPRMTPHALLALGTVALATPLASRLGKVLLLVLALLYLQQADNVQRAAVHRRAEAEARHALSLQPRLPPVGEPVGWLNSILAAGWQETIKPYFTADLLLKGRLALDELEVRHMAAFEPVL